jgi:hypothetical protein
MGDVMDDKDVMKTQARVFRIAFRRIGTALFRGNFDWVMTKLFKMYRRLKILS